MSQWVWQELGLARTADKGAIRRAYAARLKALDVDADVAGYARLRQARDTALRLASQAIAKEQAAEAQDPDEPFVNAPIQADEAEQDHTSLADGCTDRGDFDTYDDFGPYYYAPEPSGPAQPHDLASDPAPDPAQVMLQELDGLLFSGGQFSDEGFTLPDYERAVELVDALVAHAQAATLPVHQRIDHYLAGMFADSWPRSAALVERASDEFGWLGEAGSIDERYALRFLNSRVKGMRFHEKVQQPDHRLHKAWTALARPGNPGLLDGLATSKDDVRLLLNGIRERFPEVETYLNHQRVARWDRKLADNGPGLVGRIIRGIGLAYLGILAFGFIGGLIDVEPAAENTAAFEAQFDAASDRLFGNPPADGAAVEAGPDLALQLRGAFSSAPDGAERETEGFRRMRTVARLYIEVAKQQADFDTVIAIQQVKRDWLVAIRDAGLLGAGCPLGLQDIDGRWELGRLDLGDEAQAREVALLRDLVRRQAAGQLVIEEREGETLRADVPGWVVDQAAAQSGLTRERLSAALTDPESVDRCAAELAMLEVVLARPGGLSIDLLRIL